MRDPTHEDRRHTRAGLRRARRARGLCAPASTSCRLNLSHGTIEEHLARLATVRDGRRRVGRPIGVLADLPGPKVRAGQFPDGGVDLAPATPVALVPATGRAPPTRSRVDYPTLLDDLDPGDRLILGDGASAARRGRRRRDAALRRSRAAGARRDGPACTCRPNGCGCPPRPPQDLELAEAVAEAGVDFIAVSFVRTRRRRRWRCARSSADRAGIVAKIETAPALGDLEASSTPPTR